MQVDAEVNVCCMHPLSYPVMLKASCTVKPQGGRVMCRQHVVLRTHGQGIVSPPPGVPPVRALQLHPGCDAAEVAHAPRLPLQAAGPVQR